MRLVWHIVKKDFRRLWLPLALWTLLLIAKGEVGVQALANEGGEMRFFYISLCENTLVVLDVIVNLLLVAALVHEDALVGTRMFWVTRPISGGRLLAAKLLGAALMFGVLPILVAVRWWLVCGYGLPEMARAAWAVIDAQVVTVFGAMVLAALTRTMNGFIAWVIGAVVAGIALRLGVERMIDETSVSEGRRMLVVGVVALGGAGAIGLQFFMRQRAWAGLAAGGAMVGLVVALAGAADASANRERPERARQRVEFELPLRGGEERNRAGFGVRVEQVSWRDGEWRVRLLVSRPAWTNDAQRWPRIARPGQPDPWRPLEFSLVNATGGAAVNARQDRAPWERLRFGTQELAWVTVGWSAPHEQEGSTRAVVRFGEGVQANRDVNSIP